MTIMVTHKNHEVQAVFEDLDKETDRGAAVLGHAYLEELLENIIRRKTVEQNEFLGSLKYIAFRHKLTLCYIIGELGPIAFKDLQTINDVRNKFAHSRETKSFNNAYVKRKCSELQLVKDFKDTNIVSSQNARGEYIFTVSFLILTLSLIAESCEKINESVDIRLKKREREKS